jgi:phage/plasmid-like protein (TIGR03299 family)
MAYAKDRGLPWHGKGTPADGLMTAAELLEKAGLLWEVEQEPLYISGPDGGLAEMQLVKTHVANVRSSDHSILGIVGNRYRPVQNAEALSIMDDIVDSGEAKYDTAGSLWDGRRVFVSMELPKHMKVTGDDSDYVPYLGLINGHDGGQSFQIIRTQIRMVCWNTVEAAKASAVARYAARHTPGVGARVGEIRDILRLTFAEMATFEELANAMAKVRISQVRAKEVLLKVFPLAQAKDEKADLADSDFAAALANWQSTETLNDKLRGTAWGLYNAIVEYADFGLKYHKDDNRANDLMTGGGRPGEIKKVAMALLSKPGN